MDDDVRRLLQQRRYDEALEGLLDAYGDKVLHMAASILRDTGRAEEVAQDVFLKIWRAFPSYDGRAAVSTWLYAIARNTCLSVLRSESYRRTARLDEVAEPASESDPSDRIDWQRHLSRLPDSLREVIMLFYFEERSIAEVARMLDIPEGTVKSQLHRARRALADMME